MTCTPCWFWNGRKAFWLPVCKPPASAALHFSFPPAECRGTRNRQSLQTVLRTETGYPGCSSGRFHSLPEYRFEIRWTPTDLRGNPPLWRTTSNWNWTPAVPTAWSSGRGSSFTFVPLCLCLNLSEVPPLFSLHSADSWMKDTSYSLTESEIQYSVQSLMFSCSCLSDEILQEWALRLTCIVRSSVHN